VPKRGDFHPMNIPNMKGRNYGAACGTSNKKRKGKGPDPVKSNVLHKKFGTLAEMWNKKPSKTWSALPPKRRGAT